MKAKLPKSPAKYAEVVSKLIEKASPKKTNALKIKGIDSGKVKEWNEDLSSTIKETYIHERAPKVSSSNEERVCTSTCYQS